MIHPLPNVPFVKSDETEQLRAEIGAAYVQHNFDLDECTAEADALRELAGSWDADHELRAVRLRASRRRLDVRELEIRDMIDAYCDALYDDQRSAITLLREQHRAAKADILRQLVEIGFIDGPVEALRGRLGIDNDVIPRHPAVIAATQTLATAEGFSVNALREANQVERAKCEARIAAAKEAALASLA